MINNINSLFKLKDIKCHLFDIKDFEFVHGPFNLPDNIYIFRAEDPSRSIPPSYPKFFGDYEAANFYYSIGQGSRILKAYRVKPLTRVLDIRYIQATLPFLWDTHNKSSDDIDIVKMVSLVLGLTSFNRQIELLQEVLDISMYKDDLKKYIQRMKDFRNLKSKPSSWTNPVELRGVRCGITDIDYMVMGFLKELFGDLVDGIIAPALYSPFHTTINNDITKSMMYQELIIFDPSRSLREVVTSSNSLEIQSPSIILDEYIRNRFHIVTIPTSISRISLISGGKKKNKKPTNIVVPDSFGELLGDPNNTVKKNEYESFIKRCDNLVNAIVKSNIFMRYYCPNTCSFGSPDVARESRNRFVKIGIL